MVEPCSCRPDHAIITRAPSRPSTPRSCGFGLDALPLRLERKPSIPDGFCRDGGSADLSASSDQSPFSSRTTCMPPLPDALRMARGGARSVLLLFSREDGTLVVADEPSYNNGGDPDVGEPSADMCDFCVTSMEMACESSELFLPAVEGVTQSGGAPTECETGST